MSVFCPECGAKLARETLKCPDCGAPIEHEGSPAAPSVPASAASPMNKQNVPGDVSSGLVGDRNNIMGSVTGTKIDAANYAESHTIDNSRHEHSTTHDNSSHVHNSTTIIQNGEKSREYCTVCGNALEQNHGRCPECGKGICPECRVPGKNRCKACEKKARDEYRLEFRNMLLEMGGKLNAFGRRIMDDKARRLNLFDEKNEIEKEFATVEEEISSEKSFGLQTAIPAPDTPPTSPNLEQFVSEFEGENAQKGLGSLAGGTPIVPGREDDDGDSDDFADEPSYTAPATDTGTGNLPNGNKSGGACLKYILGGLVAVILLGGAAVVLPKFISTSPSEKSPTSRERAQLHPLHARTSPSEKSPTSKVNIAKPKQEPIPVPASLREVSNFTQTKASTWAQKKMPEDWAKLIALELRVKQENEKALAIAKRLEADSATWGTYPTNPDFVSAKNSLMAAETEAEALLAAIETAYANRPTTQPYTLVRGDTPTRICAKHKTTLDVLRKLNPGVEFSARKMQIGQVINVPADDASEQNEF